VCVPLQTGNVFGRLVPLEVVDHAANAGHVPRATNQAARLAFEDRARQRDNTVTCSDGDGVRMRHHGAETRANPFNENLVGHRLAAVAQGDRSRRAQEAPATVFEIRGGFMCSTPGQVSHVSGLLAQASPSPAATLGVQQIDESAAQSESPGESPKAQTCSNGHRAEGIVHDNPEANPMPLDASTGTSSETVCA
jgi:hypothetical protein